MRRVAACAAHAQRLWNGSFAARAALIIRRRFRPVALVAQSRLFPFPACFLCPFPFVVCLCSFCFCVFFAALLPQVVTTLLWLHWVGSSSSSPSGYASRSSVSVPLLPPGFGIVFTSCRCPRPLHRACLITRVESGVALCDSRVLTCCAVHPQVMRVVLNYMPVPAPAPVWLAFCFRATPPRS